MVCIKYSATYPQFKTNRDDLFRLSSGSALQLKNDFPASLNIQVTSWLVQLPVIVIANRVQECRLPFQYRKTSILFLLMIFGKRDQERDGIFRKISNYSNSHKIGTYSQETSVQGIQICRCFSNNIMIIYFSFGMWSLLLLMKAQEISKDLSKIIHKLVLGFTLKMT